MNNSTLIELLKPLILEATRPIIGEIVREVVKELGATHQADEQFAYVEADAAKKFGVGRHVLRDARLRGEIQSTRVGKRIAYTPEQIRTWLKNNNESK